MRKIPKQRRKPEITRIYVRFEGIYCLYIQVEAGLEEYSRVKLLVCYVGRTKALSQMHS
jgi:hypothetical protein